MRKSKAGLLGLIILFVLAGCEIRRNTDKTASKNYADIEGLIMKQVNAFNRKGVELEKVALVDGREERSRYQPDSLGWIRELGFFRQIDMNKPAYRQAYDSTVQMDGSRKTVTYQAKNPDEVQVQTLSVTYAGENSRVVEGLKAEFVEQNEMYTTYRRMEAAFEAKGEQGKQGLLIHYYLEGGHKIIFRDSITYRIEGRIL